MNSAESFVRREVTERVSIATQICTLLCLTRRIHVAQKCPAGILIYRRRRCPNFNVGELLCRSRDQWGPNFTVDEPLPLSVVLVLGVLFAGYVILLRSAGVLRRASHMFVPISSLQERRPIRTVRTRGESGEIAFCSLSGSENEFDLTGSDAVLCRSHLPQALSTNRACQSLARPLDSSMPSGT